MSRLVFKTVYLWLRDRLVRVEVLEDVELRKSVQGLAGETKQAKEREIQEDEQGEDGSGIA